MRKFAATALILLLAAPMVAIAGEDHQCDKSVDDCLTYMVAKLKSTGFIGVLLDEKGSALLVTKVVEGSPAESSGIKVGDELVSLNGIRFGKDTWEEMSKVKKPGNKVEVGIRRNGKAKKLDMTLVAMPADLMAKYIGEHMMTHAKTKVAQADTKKK